MLLLIGLSERTRCAYAEKTRMVADASVHFRAFFLGSDFSLTLKW